MSRFYVQKSEPKSQTASDAIFETLKARRVERAKAARKAGVRDLNEAGSVVTQFARQCGQGRIIK